MKRVWLLLFATATLGGFGPDGLTPRDSAHDYQAQETSGGVTLAVSVVPREQARKLFAADLNKAGFLVIEVAVYPEGKGADVSYRDFMMRMGSDSLRAADPSAIASQLAQKNRPRRDLPQDLAVSSTASIGYESGPGYDESGRPRQRGGLYSGAGVAVGREDGSASRRPFPPAPDQDLSVTMRKLAETALPEGNFRQPVAGYLFFPRPGGKAAKAAFQVEWLRDAGTIKVTVPAAAN